MLTRWRCGTARSVFAYGPGGGYGPLREWVAARHGVEPGRVVLTVGGLHGFVLYVAEALARRPGRVLVEGPTYDRPLKILARESAEVVALDMDEEGLDPDALGARASANARPALVPLHDPDLPESQRTDALDRAPAARSRDRRAGTVSRCWKTTRTGSFAYEGEPVPTLHELMEGELVTHTSSFSKTVAPGLRTGYFVLPADRSQGLRGASRLDVHLTAVPHPGHDRRVRGARALRAEPRERVRGELRARRDAMIASLERTFHDDASWSQPEGGYFIWLELGDGRDASELAVRGRRERRRHRAGPRLLPARVGPDSSSARLAFSYETPERIAEGVERLATLL